MLTKERRFEQAGPLSAAALLALSASLIVAPAAGDGPERGMGAQVSMRDTEDQYAPSIAAGEAGYLIVWVDESTDYYMPTYRDVRGARVDPNGTPMEPDKNGFFLGSVHSLNYQYGPVVAFGGDSYLVAWTNNGEVQTSLVAPSAPSPLLTPASVAIPNDKTYRDLPAAARADAAYVVVWIEGDFLYSLRGARVGAENGALDPGQPFTIADLPPDVPNYSRPALACADASCLVVYTNLQSNQIFGALVAANNAVSPPFLISNDAADPLKPASGEHRFPAVAFDGASYVVTWQSVGPVGPLGSSVRGALVGTDGKVLPAGGVEIAALGSYPQIAARPGEPALVTWASPMEDGSLRASRVDTASGITPLEPGGVLIQTSGSGEQEHDQPAPAALDEGGMKGLVAWSGKQFGLGPSRDVYTSIMGLSGPLTSAQRIDPISKNWNHQAAPAVLWNSQTEEYLVAWRDSDNNSGTFEGLTEIAGAIVGRDGVAVSKHALAPSNSAFDSARLAAAAGTTNVLIAWLELDIVDTQYLHLKAALVDPNGALLSSEPIGITGGAFNAFNGSLSDVQLSAAFDGSAYVLVWSMNDRVHASLLSAGGDVLKDNQVIFDASALGEDISTAVSAYGGSGDLMVAWTTQDAVFCEGIRTAGDAIEVPSGEPRKLGDVSSNAQLAVAYDGEGSYLIAWTDREPNDDVTLRGTRVTRSGERLDVGFVIAEEKSTAETLATMESVRVVFDGTSYLAVWKSGLVAKGAWVSRDGRAHGSAGFVVAEEHGLLGDPVVASDGAGRSLVAFSRSHFTDEMGVRFDVDRVRARIIDNGCEVPMAVSCQPENPCLAAGACDPETRECSYFGAQPDGALCEGGLCIGGECVPDSLAPEGPGAGSGASGGVAPLESVEGICGCKEVGAGGHRGAPFGLFVAALIAALRSARGRRASRG